MARKFRSRRLKHLYESAKVLHEIGAITAERLREYEADCVLPETASSRGTSCVAMPTPAYAAGSGPDGGYARVG